MSQEILTSAFTGLSGRLRRLALRLLPAGEDADDVLQEAFCRLWPKAGELANMQQAEGAVTVTIRNLCIDTLRRRAAAPQAVGTDALLRERDSRPVADVELELREQFEAVERIIESSLTPAQRRVLRLRELEGLDAAQIAAREGVSPEAVRMQLSRARKAVRECYNKTIHEYDDENRHR